MGRLAVLASGSGSNFEALVNRIHATDHEVCALICDRPRAYVVERAARHGVPVHLVDYRGRRTEAERDLLDLLERIDPDLIALAGFMRILPERIAARFSGRMVNIHPSLLPRFPGTHAIERSYASGDTELGITIHYVDSGVDTGPVIAQRRFTRNPADTLERTERRIHELEHELFPEVIARLLDGLPVAADRSPAGVAG